MKKLCKKRFKCTTFKSKFDALGSYTGTNNTEPYELPEQDADDL